MQIHNHIVAKHQLFMLKESGQCTLRQVSERLDLSYRQTKRWWSRYRAVRGSLVDLAVSSPRGGGWNRKNGSVFQAVIDCRKTHPHRSLQHISETVTDAEGSVSTATVRRILASADLLKNREAPQRVHTRFESSSFGERLQMDTTSGAWLPGYRLVYLIALIDEYSRMLVSWKWTDSDSAWNNMGVIRESIKKHGLPRMLYTDNASMFKTIRHGKSIHQTHKSEGYETEIQRAMRELGVVMFSHKPYQPQGKGKIERFFRFVQERFVREHTAKTLEELNHQFEPWAKWYNTRHVNRTTGQKSKDRTTPSVFGPVPDRRRLDSAFSFKVTRKVDKCNMIQFMGGLLRIDPKYILCHRTVDIEYTPHEIRVYHQGQFIERFERLECRTEYAPQI